MLDRLKLLLDYLKEDPSDPFTRFALAQEYLKRGDSAEAASYYEGLVADTPDYVGTYYHLGKLYERLDRRDEALAMYEQGIDVAKRLRDFHALSELQAALQQGRNAEWDE